MKILAIATSEMTTITTLLTTFSPRFCNPKAAMLALEIQKVSPQKPESIQGNREIHHNSPQMPKSGFIHNQVVRPQLLTQGVCVGGCLCAEGRLVGRGFCGIGLGFGDCRSLRRGSGRLRFRGLGDAGKIEVLLHGDAGLGGVVGADGTINFAVHFC